MKDNNNWNTEIENPLEGREIRSDKSGLTMVLDKGLGLNTFEDILNTAGEYINYLKLSFGTSFIYPLDIIKKKIKMVKEYNIDIYPGGTLFEIAFNQNKVNEYLFRAKQLGFTAVEISDGVVFYGNNVRKNMINKARELGLKVLTEVGKKDNQFTLSSKEIISQIRNDISNGAHKVIIEARESGKDISIYDKEGSIDINVFEKIIKSIQDNKDMIIWEAPLKKQQLFYINNIGNNVNLGNIKPEEVIALEALRRGLRGDTFKNVLNKNMAQSSVSN
ncbi:MAG: phosphosulfolactate synthase [Halanaerobiales bacterium]